MKIKFEILLFTILLSLNLYSQYFQVYEDKNVKIELKKSSISLNDIKNSIPTIYIVTNKSDNPMLVGLYGFAPNNSIIYNEKNAIVEFRKKRLFDGYPATFEGTECNEIFVEINKKETIEMKLGLYKFPSFDFDFDENKNYLLRVFSQHNERTATLQGCSKFVSDEKTKGIKILDIYIDKEIPLTK